MKSAPIAEKNIQKGKHATANITRRKMQAKETKERIYACADRLFREKGYDETSVAEIASAAEISIGGFYHHFSNKEEIMRLWLLGLDDKYLMYYNEVLRSPQMRGASCLEKIRSMMAAVNRIFLEHGHWLNRMAYSLMIRDRNLSAIVSSPRRDFFRIVEALVREAVERGELREGIAVDKIVKNITVLSRGCKVEWLLQDEEALDLTEMEDALLCVYLSSIAKKTAD